jgi:dGTPase
LTVTPLGESRSQRRYPTSSQRDDERTPFERDRDRVLYSDEFRRLGGVTQVVSPSERQLIHTRLTHSLEVAQIGRALANRILATVEDADAIERAGGLDPFVVEAAALIHDLGHPPFGHVIEHLLQDLLTANGLIEDGFEGNAQSFRIVTKLSIQSEVYLGMNLTRATLAATLKYPWFHASASARRDKWGSYDSEAEDFEFARAFADSNPHVPTLEAALMDWADDIAYAVHDMDDFVRAGMIPLDQLIGDESERSRFIELEMSRQERASNEQEQLSDAFEGVLALAPRASRNARMHRADLRNLSSALVNRYITAPVFNGNGFGKQSLTIGQEYLDEVAMLKGLTWQYVIRGQGLATQRYGQRHLVRSLFELFLWAAQEPDDWVVFPSIMQERLASIATEKERYRTVSDLIASMTERQVVDVYMRLTGQSLGSALDQALL